MNRLTAVFIFILLGFNSLAVSYLVINRSSGSGTFLQGRMNESEIAQFEKIFNLAVDFRSELENVASRASYPTDKKKNDANEYLQNHRMVFEKVRLEYKRLHEERTKEAAVKFLFGCWGDDEFFSGPSLMGVNKWAFAQYNNVAEDYTPYPNVSFGKLESINNEFRVLAISLMKDLK